MNCEFEPTSYAFVASKYHSSGRSALFLGFGDVLFLILHLGV